MISLYLKITEKYRCLPLQHGFWVTNQLFLYILLKLWWCTCRVTVKSMNCGIVVSEFELQSNVDMKLNKESKPNILKSWKQLFLATHPYQPLPFVSTLNSVRRELTSVIFCLSANTGVLMCTSPLGKALTFTAVPSIFCLSYLDCVHDGRKVVFCMELFPGFLQKRTVFLCSFQLTFSPGILSKSKWSKNIIVLTQNFLFLFMRDQDSSYLWTSNGC